MKAYKIRVKLLLVIFFILFFSKFTILADAEDPNDPISIEFGVTITASISVAAEMDAYSFSLNAGDSVFVRMSKIDYDIHPFMKLYAPNGSLLVEHHSSYATTDFVHTVSEGGVYTVFAGDYAGIYTGKYNIFFQRINNPYNAVSVTFGKTYADSLNLIGGIDTYSISLDASDSVFIRMSQIQNIYDPYIRLYASNGSLLAEDSSFQADAEFVYTTSKGGVFTVLAGTRFGTNTSSYGIYFQKINNPRNSISAKFGETYSGSLDLAAEMDAYSFSLNAGDSVFVRISEDDYDIHPLIRLYASNGSLLVDSPSSMATTDFVHTVSTSGLYTVLAGDRFGISMDNYSVYIQKINNPGNTTSPKNNETINASINSFSEMNSYIFSANAGDSVLVRMSQIYNVLDPMIRLYASNGSLLTSASEFTPDAEFTYSFSESGVFTVLAGDYLGIKTGNYSIYFHGIQYLEQEITTIEEGPPVKEIIIVTGAAAGVALIGILTTGWGKYKFLSFLGLLGPLYLRTVKEDVFDNEKRLSMYNHIAEHQPVIYSEIKKTCNLSDGEINWHAHMMIQLDLIRVERKGFHLFFKLYGKKIADEKFIRLTDAQKIILDLINKKSGITQAEIAKKLEFKQQNISYNLLKLEEKGKIRFEKIGRIKHYYMIKKDVSSA